MSNRRPIIGITCDVSEPRFQVGRAYADRVWAAGGLPIVLPCIPSAAPDLVSLCDGLVLTGGDDPIMSDWGQPQHPSTTPVHPHRQEFERAILAALERTATKPALGVCLGMQFMGLHAGGRLNQHLPDTLATAGDHWDRRQHPISGELGRGLVQSHHRQAIDDPGTMKVVAQAPDGVIEAIRDDARPFYLGVQWHPERTDDPTLGQRLFDQLVAFARQAV